jgi:hypothetical protein
VLLFAAPVAGRSAAALLTLGTVLPSLTLGQGIIQVGRV